VPLSFDQLSALDYTIESWQAPDDNSEGASQAPLEILAIAFTGPYTDDGNDAAFMEGVITWALLAWDANGLVLDFRNLSYEWGDRMQNVLNVGFSRRDEAEQLVNQIFAPNRPSVLPTAVIFSEKCRDGLESLVHEEMGGYSGTLVETEEQALAFVIRQWKRQGLA
jgi:hypothetical protein